mmetsp:Transcript_11013/g.28447  ORF Transcript_11013/g.28447 Transcript_11013/m.28447 type:complete len:343 (-) Transcript_11013:1288-2316(-)
MTSQMTEAAFMSSADGSLSACSLSSFTLTRTTEPCAKESSVSPIRRWKRCISSTSLCVSRWSMKGSMISSTVVSMVAPRAISPRRSFSASVRPTCSSHSSYCSVLMRSSTSFRFMSFLFFRRMTLDTTSASTMGSSSSAIEPAASGDSVASLAKAATNGRHASLNRVRSRPGTRSICHESRTSGQILMKGRQFAITGLRNGSSSWARPSMCFTSSDAKSCRLMMGLLRHFRKSRALRGPRPGMKAATDLRCGDRRTLFTCTPALASVCMIGHSRALLRRLSGTTCCKRCSFSFSRAFSRGSSCHNWQVSARGSCVKRAALIAMRCIGISASLYTPSSWSRGW